MKLLLLSITLLFFATDAFAVNARFLKDTVLSRLDKAEIDSFRGRVRDALDESPDQKIIHWRSDTSKRKGRARIKYSYDIDGRTCRHITLEITELEQRDIYNADLCREGQNWAVMATPTADFSGADWTSFEKELRSGLQKAVDGQTVNWVNQNLKFSAVFDFVSTETTTDMTCRQVKIRVTGSGNAHARGEYVFCKSSGEWARNAVMEVD